MQCLKCQFDNANGMNFCGKCGYKLPPFLKAATQVLSFDEKLEKIQKYLPKGLTEKILSQRDKIEGERKHVTVMFCDMVGFTQLSKILGPEETYSVMDQVYEILIHIVQDHEGTVNEFTGDGIMALFGAPIAIEDAPQRAIRSAYAIHREISRFSDKKNHEKVNIPPLKMRIGIHTGPVVVGTLGNDLRVEFKAVGDTVNLASRVQGLAEPGNTYLTKDTFKLTKGLSQFEALGEKKIKGLKEPVPIYKLLSIKEELQRPRIGFERMLYSEMVGRDRELDRLQMQVMKVINGEGSIVNIIGEAGIGKSRLVAELKTSDVIKKMILLEGRAISIGRNLSFHLIISLLKEWAQIREDDSGAAAFSKLETAIRRVDPEEMREALPFVATLMGMKLSGPYAERVKGIEGDALEKLILKNVRDLLTKATEVNPLVLVSEDLHWADTSSIELMESMFSLVETQRILFVNVFRPGHRETIDRVAESVKLRVSSHYVEIVLQPLDERMSETLINNMLKIKGLQQTFINQIVDRAGGNPFFIEEVVRSFVDEGAIVANKGAFEVTEKIDTMIIPNTINDVLMARIDRLEEETRNLVKVASVIGRNFFYRILAEVTKTVEDIENRLSYLKEIQLIRERKRMEEIEYLFKHALAQEAAYESLLLRKRREIHLRVAYSIEKVFKERLHEFYGMLAYHYSRGEDEDKAQEFLIKAGEEALKSSASSEALHYYQEALNLYLKVFGTAADSEKVASIEKNIALALYYRGRYPESISYIDNVLEFHGFTDPGNIFSQVTRMLSGLLHLIVALYLPIFKWRKTPSENDRDIVNLVALKAEMYTHTDPVKFLICTASLAKILTRFELAKIKEGIKVFVMLAPCLTWPCISFKLAGKIIESVKGKIEETDSKALMWHRFGETMLSSIHLGFEFEKEHYDESLVESSLKIGEFFAVSSYLVFCAWIEIERGRFDEAKSFSEKLLEIAETYDNEYARSINYEVSIRMYLKFRKLYEALSEAEEGIPIMDKVEFNGLLAYMYGHKAQTQILLKDIEGAEKSLKLARDYEKRARLLVPMWLSAVVLGQFIFDLRRFEEALKNGNSPQVSFWRKKALKSGKREMKIVGKLAQDRTAAYRHMGVYYWLAGKKKKAALWWERSMREGESLNAKIPLSRTYFEVGKRMLEPGCECKTIRGNEADQYLEKAKEMFEAMRLHWDTEELEKVLGTSRQGHFER